MEKFYKGRNDAVFKALLADPEDTFLLKTLLELILGKEIKDIQFSNAELLKRSALERAKIPDLTITVDGIKIQIEMNSAFYNGLHYRNFNFFTTIINQHDRKGTGLDYNQPYLHIDFAYGLQSDLPFEIEYNLSSKFLLSYIDNVTFKEFNMDYITKSWYYVVEEREKYAFIDDVIKSLNVDDITTIWRKSDVLYNAKDNIVPLLEYMGIVLYEKLREKNEIKYANGIKIIEKAKQRILANANYDMSIDDLLLELWEEFNS